MNTSKQTQIAQTFFEAMQTNDYNQWSALLSDNYVGNYPGLTGANKAMAQTFNSVFSVAFPDLKFNIKNIFEVGNTVVFEWSGGGTHTGPLATLTGQVIPPTNRKGMIDGVLVSEIKDSKIVSERTYWDQVALMKQLGLM